MDINLDYHKDHKEWKSKLDFYKDEISFFFKELNMVFDRDKENLARMEFIDEYEAILDKNADKIKDLVERIDAAEKELSDEENKSKPSVHHQLHLDIIKFERSYQDMKKRFKRFASRND